MKKFSQNQIKKNIEYAHNELDYIKNTLDKQHKQKKFFDISMLVVLCIGGLFCFLWNHSALLSTIIVASANFTVSIFPLMKGKDDIAILNRLFGHYTHYLYNLEKLKSDLIEKTKDEAEIARLFFTYQYDIMIVENTLKGFLSNKK